MNKRKIQPRRLNLRGWAVLDSLRREIDRAVEAGDWSAIPEYLYQTIETCVDKFDRNMYWEDAASLYNQSVEVNAPGRKFPILTSKEKGKEMPWEYRGRSWYFWCNLFAKNYGWDMDMIGDMDIDDAIGLFQEISIDEQMEKEWNYGLSEVSYEYNSSTKKSHYKPLPRPDWMRPMVGKQTPVKKVRMPAAMAPTGMIIGLDESK